MLLFGVSHKVIPNLGEQRDCPLRRFEPVFSDEKTLEAVYFDNVIQKKMLETSFMSQSKRLVI